jgi:D-alanine-D-alanine ligase
MKKVVALIYGGDSSEAEVSVKSGRHVSAHLDRNLFEVHEIMLKGRDWSVKLPSGGTAQIEKSDFSYSAEGRKVTFDIALIMIHGTPGENGLLQAYLEMVGVPYTTCSSTVSYLFS